VSGWPSGTGKATALWPGRDRLGLPIDGFNGQIAAICRTRDAALATRNAKDFEETGIDAIDPWQQSQPADHSTPPTT
jgi:predicted nucleic acid-binding protein